MDHGINPDGGTWRLVFKLFSFYDPLNLKLSKVEREFLFEQAFESVLNKKFPADDETLIKLAALRTQYTVGDYEDGAYISDMIKVHPAQAQPMAIPPLPRQHGVGWCLGWVCGFCLRLL